MHYHDTFAAFLRLSSVYIHGSMQAQTTIDYYKNKLDSFIVYYKQSKYQGCSEELTMEWIGPIFKAEMWKSYKAFILMFMLKLVNYLSCRFF